jgi:hypothetical protein
MQTFKSVLYDIGCGFFPTPEIEINFEQHVQIEDRCLMQVTGRNNLDILKYIDRWAYMIKESQEDIRI